MHQKHWTFTQPESNPSSTWEVNNIPDDAEGAVITHIITTNGQILQPENQIIAPYGLQLSFGVQDVAGVAYGNYFAKDEIVVSGDGGVINVTINQNNNPRV